MIRSSDTIARLMIASLKNKVIDHLEYQLMQLFMEQSLVLICKHKKKYFSYSIDFSESMYFTQSKKFINSFDFTQSKSKLVSVCSIMYFTSTKLLILQVSINKLVSSSSLTVKSMFFV